MQYPKFIPPMTFIYFRHLRKKKNPHRKNLSGIKINLFFQAILINFFVLRCTQWGATLVKISFPRGVHVEIIEYVIQVTREISSCSVISNFVSCKLAVKISTMVDAARKITTLIIPLRSFLPCNRGSPDNFLFIPGQNVFVNCQFPLLTRIYIYTHRIGISFLFATSTRYNNSNVHFSKFVYRAWNLQFLLNSVLNGG